MCTYNVYVRFVIGFFFPSLRPLSWCVISRKSAAMPRCRGLVRTLLKGSRDLRVTWGRVLFVLLGVFLHE